MTILFAGGGTGGHLYPGLAVATALAETWPAARPLFLCTTREIDRLILGDSGFPFVPQPIVPPVRSISGLLRFWRSWRETRDLVRNILRQYRPAAALGLGGYAAGVAVKHASLSGVPAAILNPDAIPGRANRYLMKYVQAVCCQFAQTRTCLPPEHQPKVRLTGCPIRPEICSPPPRSEAAARLSLDSRLLTLTVTGASLGAQTINQAMPLVLQNMNLQGWQVLHLAGREHALAVTAAYRRNSQPARVIDFTPAMADVWAVTDLAVCRAGASTCAELAVCGIPSVLMPYPYHKDLHQRVNAKVLADAGAAVLVDDRQDPRSNAEELRPVLEPLLRDADRRSSMASAARALARPDAARQVASILRVLAESRLQPSASTLKNPLAG